MNQVVSRPIVPKTGHVRSRKLLDSSKGQPCTLLFPGCRDARDTTVAAHSNESLCGKGKSIKASDLYSVDADSWCHGILDGTIPSSYSREEKLAYFWRAFVRTTNRRLADGLIVVAGAK